MGREIERKYLVKGTAWRDLGTGERYRQGYLNSAKERVVRVRLIEGADRGVLTIKGITQGVSRAEYEYDIPPEDTREMLETLCERPIIDKTRRKIAIDDLVWEIDEFHGENQGLVIAEIELEREDQGFEKIGFAREAIGPELGGHIDRRTHARRVGAHGRQER
ncbi:MAG: CYTH domain-containing protein, partial [bacterium]|nr:CYTH domain-containing protein [bacterium]